MTVDVSVAQGVATIALRGDVVERSSADLREVLLDVLATEHVVLDLRDLRSLDQLAVDAVIATEGLRALMGRPLTVLRATEAIRTVPVPGARLHGTLRAHRRVNRRARRRQSRRRVSAVIATGLTVGVGIWAGIRWR